MNSQLKVYPANYNYTWADVAPQSSWVEGMIPVGGSVLLFGPAGTGKTTLACNLMNTIVQQQQFLGRNTTQTPCALLSLDTPQETMKRRWVGSKPPFKPAFDFCPYEPFNCLDPLFDQSQLYQDFKRVLAPRAASDKELAKPQTGLVIVDSLRDVFDGDMNNDDFPKRVYNVFQKWTDRATVIFLHHTRKQQIAGGKIVASNGDDEATGSKYWINKAQVALYLKKVNESVLQIQMGKSQCFEEWDTPLKMEMDGAYISLWDKHKQATMGLTYSTAQQWVAANDPNWPAYDETEKDAAIAAHLNVSSRTVRRMKAAYRKQI